jgi:hypothetical protein
MPLNNIYYIKKIDTETRKWRRRDRSFPLGGKLGSGVLFGRESRRRLGPDEPTLQSQWPNRVQAAERHCEDLRPRRQCLLLFQQGCFLLNFELNPGRDALDFDHEKDLHWTAVAATPQGERTDSGSDG